MKNWIHLVETNGKTFGKSLKGMFKSARNELEGGPNDGGNGKTETGAAAAEPPKTVQCPKCFSAVREEEYKANLYVCLKCGHHGRMPARKRLAALCDAGSFLEHGAEMESRDPIGFPSYAEKTEKARKNSGEKESVLTGEGSIGGIRCCLFVMEGAFMMGSMGSVTGEKIAALFEYAAEKGLPVIGYTVSGGARMQEGMFSLMQMAKVSAAVKRHAEAGGLYITVITDPTTGGVTASFAMQGDIILSEPGALIGFAGPRVIQQTINQTLPEGFQTAEYVLQCGFLDDIVPRQEQKNYLKRILALHGYQKE